MDEPVHQYDELVDAAAAPAPATTRQINLILDPSSFTRGIGNIKRWYNPEYVQSYLRETQPQEINLYIPSYTLHEFDYLKKGTSMIATNTRQSVRFIDQLFETSGTSTQVLDNFHVNMAIESPSEKGPPWNNCRRYQVHSPRVREFPNYKTKFDSSYLGKNEFDLEFVSVSKTNDIQYENSQPYQRAAANADQEAVMPARLKYLISSCIYKRYMEPPRPTDLEQWKLVSEDSITRVWANSFGIDCMNVNEAELLMFQGFDPTTGYNPNSTLVHSQNVLQGTIDTSGGDTGKEPFDTMNYAPRGKGQLWKPKR